MFTKGLLWKPEGLGPHSAGPCTRTMSLSRFLGCGPVTSRFYLRCAGMRSPFNHRPNFRKQPNPLNSHDRSIVGDILATSSVDEMLHAAHIVLTSAERRLGDYCSTFARDSTRVNAAGGASRRCWHIYRSLREARRQAEAEAGAEAVTTGHAGSACQHVEVLEQLIRELEYVPIEDMCRVLATNQKLLHAFAAKNSSQRLNAAWVDRAASLSDRNGNESSGSSAGSDSEAQLNSGVNRDVDVGKEGNEKPIGEAKDEQRAAASTEGVVELRVVEGLERQRAEAVFKGLDRSDRGWLDRGDLLAGLDMLGERVDPSDVEQMCLELGSTGRVDMQTFCDIVEAERLMVPGSDAVFLRHLRHDRPEWWTETPPFLDSI